MSATLVNRALCVEWSVATRPLPGEAVSGDLHVVSAWAHGVLLAAIDGLGHGSEATIAARAAADELAAHAGEPVTLLVERCHRALKNTRGVAMTLVSIDTRDHTASWLGIGNVETALLRGQPHAAPRRESVLLRGGVVGYRLPALTPAIVAIAPGDIFAFATDGVRESFADGLSASEPVAQQVDRLMAKNFRGTDDGLVLAGKYLGRP